MSILSGEPNFRSLSIKDLLEARDLYHWHLMNKENVIGTAIGLYLIRKDEDWPSSKATADGRPKSPPTYPRTFDNSEVRPYSWPCILVLVKDWVEARDFRGKRSPSNMVPPTLYLPDGRAAPVCVVKVQPGEPRRSPGMVTRWPDSYIGGGFPLLQEVQGEEHVASVGCLVTDGHRTFALTNRHATGEPGSVVSARLRGNVVEVGRATDDQLTRKEFSEVFPEFPGRRTFLTLDVALVDVTNAGDWTSQPYGLPAPVGDVADLNELNLSLQFIDQPVLAFGAVSGFLEGRIKALFYRHKSRAGFDYVSEFLIAPSDPDQQTCPGDSGTIWHLVTDGKDAAGKESKLLRPLAIEWGGQALVGSGGNRFNFALATGLSTACELLDVDLVQDHDTGPQPFWGQTGHYSIAEVAIGLVQNPDLRKFLQTNLERISFRPDQLSADEIHKKLLAGDFVELADVPDLVWKKVKSDVPGGRDYAQNTGPEHPNHYADIDLPGADKKTLRDLTLSNPANMSVEFWRQWYAANGTPNPTSQGLLPFRVWQIFDEMVKHLQAGDAAHFLCAAGVISHYVGDACQPLHGSYLSDGRKPDSSVEKAADSNGHKKSAPTKWPGKGVHSTYEDKMVDRHSKELLDGIGAVVKAGQVPRIDSGQSAALATVSLMANVAGVIPPSKLVDTYIGLGGGTSVKVVDGLWAAFGKATMQVMATGAQHLAAIWDAAFALAPAALAPTAIPEATLASIYKSPDFAPSYTLAHIGPVLQGAPAAAPPRRMAAGAGRVRRVPASKGKARRR